MPEQPPDSPPSAVKRLGAFILRQRADFSSIAAVSAAALLASALGTAAHVVLRAPLPKGVSADDAAARAQLAAAKRRAAAVGLRALGAASAGSAALALALVGGFRLGGIEKARCATHCLATHYLQRSRARSPPTCARPRSACCAAMAAAEAEAEAAVLALAAAAAAWREAASAGSAAAAAFSRGASHSLSPSPCAESAQR